MTRPVFLLFCLISVAIGLARPAQAQWTKGVTYYDGTPAISKTKGTTVVSTPIGYVTVTATSSSSAQYTNGSFNGQAIQPYTWSGAASVARTNFSETQVEESNGVLSGGSGGASSSTSYTSGSTTNSPGLKYDMVKSATITDTFGPNDVTTTTTTDGCSLAASAGVQQPAVATAKASVQFGNPTTPH